MSVTLHLTSSEQHGAAAWLNEKQFEETGNNPRQAPAGCHKKRDCLSSLSLLPSTLTLWADERSMGRLGSRSCACCLPVHQEVSQLQNTKKKKKKKRRMTNPSILMDKNWVISEIVLCVSACECVCLFSFLSFLQAAAAWLTLKMLNASIMWLFKPLCISSRPYLSLFNTPLTLRIQPLAASLLICTS